MENMIFDDDDSEKVGPEIDGRTALMMRRTIVRIAQAYPSNEG